MDDLAEWLTQVWDEQQAIAEQASPSPWHLNDEHSEVWAADDIEVCTAFALSNNQLRWTARHIAANDPASVLARIAAYRQVLALHVYTVDGTGWVDCTNCGEVGNDVDGVKECLHRRLLAQPYSDRPGFRDEWRVN